MKKPHTVKLSLTVENSQTGIRLGEQLQAGREKLGLSVAEVAEQLCMNPLRIEELEQDNYDNMAGATYTRGYLRNYARLIKLDDAQMVHLYEQVQELPEGRQAAPLIEPMIEGNLPHHMDSASRYIGLLLLLALLMVGGWWWQSQRVADNRVVNSTAIDQPSSAAVIVSADPGGEITPDSTAPNAAVVQAATPAESQASVPGATTANQRSLSTTDSAAMSASTAAASDSAAAPAAVSDSAAAGQQAVASPRPSLPAGRQQSPSVTTNQDVKGQAVKGKTGQGQTKQELGNKTVGVTSTVPKTAPAQANVRLAGDKRASAESVTITSRASSSSPGKQSRTTGQPKKSTTVDAHVVSNTVARARTGRRLTAKKKAQVMPKLQLSDDFRTLTLYFDLGSWVDIRDATGKRLINRMVVQGRTLSKQGTPPFKIFLGNRQGVRIMYRGKPVQIQDNGTGMFVRFVVGKPLADSAR